MYISELALGVWFTLGAEALALILTAIYQSWKKKK